MCRNGKIILSLGVAGTALGAAALATSIVLYKKADKNRKQTEQTLRRIIEGESVRQYSINNVLIERIDAVTKSVTQVSAQNDETKERFEKDINDINSNLNNVNKLVISKVAKEKKEVKTTTKE